MESRWLLARTQPRREAVAIKHVTRQGASTYFPKYLEQVVEKGQLVQKPMPLFPSYLFIFCKSVSISWIENTIGVTKLVRVGIDPALVPEKIIADLKAHEDAFGNFVLDQYKEEGFAVGDYVRPVVGPFVAFSGIVCGMLPKQRIAVLMRMFGREARVVCNRSDLVAA